MREQLSLFGVCQWGWSVSSSVWCVIFFEDYRGGAPTGWPHTTQPREPDCWGPEAKPHR